MMSRWSGDNFDQHLGGFHCALDGRARLSISVSSDVACPAVVRPFETARGISIEYFEYAAVRHRSRRGRSRPEAPRPEHAERSDLERTRGAARARQLAGSLDRLIERRTIDDIEAEELLLGLGERAVDHQRLTALPDGGRGGRRQQSGDWPQSALVGELLLHDRELGHDGVILLLGPGADDIFGIVAKDGVKHGGAPRLSWDEWGWQLPTRGLSEIAAKAKPLRPGTESIGPRRGRNKNHSLK